MADKINTDVSMEFHLDEVERELDRKKNLALKDVGLEAEGDAKLEIENEPRHFDTGRLRSSITHMVEGDDVYIGTNVEYGKYVHEGTGIYAVEGGGRKTPWWYKGSDDEWHKTRGIKPNRFLRNAIEQNTEKYKQIMDDDMRDN